MDAEDISIFFVFFELKQNRVIHSLSAEGNAESLTLTAEACDTCWARVKWGITPLLLISLQSLPHQFVTHIESQGVMDHITHGDSRERVG